MLVRPSTDSAVPRRRQKSSLAAPFNHQRHRLRPPVRRVFRVRLSSHPALTSKRVVQLGKRIRSWHIPTATAARSLAPTPTDTARATARDGIRLGPDSVLVGHVVQQRMAASARHKGERVAGRRGDVELRFEMHTACGSAETRRAGERRDETESREARRDVEARGGTRSASPYEEETVEPRRSEEFR